MGRPKMKLLFQFLISFIAASSMSRERSNMFLKSDTRTKCGDTCAKDKDTCHRSCESWGGGGSCDCCCVNQMKDCKCNRCGFEDACEETIWEPCYILIENGHC